jgi:2-dehydro-3-deoxygluconokinase
METKDSDVLTFGETMLRLSPPGRLRFGQSDTLTAWVAGSESNVAAALTALGVSVTWVSRLPDNEMGRKVACTLRACGVDVSSVVWTDPADRVGLLYTEAAAPPRPALVIYDRAHSAASHLSPADLADALFATHRHLHVTGITPALSPTCAETTGDAVRCARTAGLTISLDINYRAKLWTPEAACSALSPLASGVDVLICSRDDAARVFGEAGDDAERAESLRTRFDARWVVLTVGGDGAVICDDTACVAVPAVPIETTVDRFGSGDALAAGILAGWLQDLGLEDSLRLGAATAALKRTIPGDLLLATRAEIDAVLAQDTGANWR